MLELSLEFIFKARYYQLGQLNHQTRQVWFVLHGYGQLARYFIMKFSSLERHNVCVIAPEGLSRFYIEEVEKRAVSGNNRVGATWMTAENRLMDIQNYLHYLTELRKKVMKDFPGVPVTLLGFSQGAATASRWVLHDPACCGRFILWSGVFPPDLDFELGKQILAEKDIALVYGSTDPYLSENRLAELKALTNKLSIDPEVVTFDGGHEIDEATLQKFV